MSLNLPKSIVRTASYLVIALALLTITAAGIAVTTETHDSKSGTDLDFFNQHACPSKGHPEFRQSLAPSNLRPNEDDLWKMRLKQTEMQLSEFLQYTPDDLKETERQRITKYLNEVKSNESHFRVEVRRTILEMEARHPLFMCTQGSYFYDFDKLKINDSLYWSRGCCYNTGDPSHLHDCARTDTLCWYAGHGVYPSNYSKPPKLEFSRP
jgi:hypothetical protein